jgi:DNA repair protein RadC
MTDDGTAAAVSNRACGAVCDEIRQAAHLLRDGDLLVFFLDGSSRVILKVALAEGTHHVDELFLRHLTSLVDEIDAATVVLTSVRGNGQPRRVDRLLWREMQRRLATAQSVLADLLVAGGAHCWSSATRRRISYGAGPNPSVG